MRVSRSGKRVSRWLIRRRLIQGGKWGESLVNRRGTRGGATLPDHDIAILTRCRKAGAQHIPLDLLNLTSSQGCGIESLYG